jgi:hypothetical protein
MNIFQKLRDAASDKFSRLWMPILLLIAYGLLIGKFEVDTGWHSISVGLCFTSLDRLMEMLFAALFQFFDSALTLGFIGIAHSIEAIPIIVLIKIIARG